MKRRKWAICTLEEELFLTKMIQRLDHYVWAVAEIRRKRQLYGKY